MFLPAAQSSFVFICVFVVYAPVAEVAAWWCWAGLDILSRFHLASLPR